MDELHVISLELENGAQVDYGVLAIFALNRKQYIALIPVREDGNPENAEVVLYGYLPTEDGSDYEIYEIEDEGQYRAASAAFERVVTAVVNDG